MSCASIDVPEYHPLTERHPERRKTGETCSDGAAPTMSKVPLTASPPCTAPIASPLVAVARMTAAPPSFCSSAAGSWAWLSMYPAAPSRRACGSLSLPRAMPIVWKPILAAYCTPRWPSPPRPSTATTSPGRAPLWRSALKVVRPAHIRGAASTGSRPAGIRATALTGAIRYSA